MKSIKILKKKLKDNRLLEYTTTHGDSLVVEFEWNKPTTKKEIEKFENENNIKLPESYKQLLMDSNGVIMFEDPTYGGAGIKLLGLDEIASATKERIEWGYSLHSSWIVFAELLDGSDFLLFDSSSYDTNNYIIDGDTGYKVEEWDRIRGDFEVWLDRLITVNGDRYWRWY